VTEVAALDPGDTDDDAHCLATILKTWHFRPPSDGKEAKFTFTFRFHANGKYRPKTTLRNR
jgi:hypothetical protein